MKSVHYEKKTKVYVPKVNNPQILTYNKIENVESKNRAECKK